MTELGETNGRIHLHGIVWGATTEDIDKWNYGYTYIGRYVSENTIEYITKYMLKLNPSDKEFKGKVLCSPKIGIGYMSRYTTIEKIYINQTEKQTKCIDSATAAKAYYPTTTETKYIQMTNAKNYGLKSKS